MYIKMIRNILMITISYIFITGVTPIEASELNINARSAILMDAETGQVYYAKDGDKKSSPASLTKLMTAIIAVENGDMNDVVEVSSGAASISTGSTIGLNKGDQITLGNLLKAALIISANDATVAIAEHVGGNHDSFIYQMNRKAILLDAYDTRFVNTNGYYDPKHNTSAYDLGLITMYALQKPLINELVSTKEAEVSWIAPEKEKKVESTNRLLKAGEVEGIDGVKTGTTAKAGKCFIASSTRGDKRLITVVLHAGNRYKEATKLIEYGFSEVRPVVIFPAGKKLTEVQVKNAEEKSVSVHVPELVRVNIAKDQRKNIKLNIKLLNPPSAPVREGQVLGHAIFTVNGYRLIKVPLVASREVPPKSMFAKIMYWLSG